MHEFEFTYTNINNLEYRLGCKFDPRFLQHEVFSHGHYELHELPFSSINGGMIFSNYVYRLHDHSFIAYPQYYRIMLELNTRKQYMHISYIAKSGALDGMNGLRAGVIDLAKGIEKITHQQLDDNDCIVLLQDIYPKLDKYTIHDIATRHEQSWMSPITKLALGKLTDIVYHKYSYIINKSIEYSLQDALDMQLITRKS